MKKVLVTTHLVGVECEYLPNKVYEFDDKDAESIVAAGCGTYQDSQMVDSVVDEDSTSNEEPATEIAVPEVLGEEPATEISVPEVLGEAPATEIAVPEVLGEVPNTESGNQASDADAGNKKTSSKKAK